MSMSIIDRASDTGPNFDPNSVPDIAVSNHALQDYALVFSGVDGSLVHVLEYPLPFDKKRVGCSVAGVGDVNGDSIPDIAVGSRTADEKVFFYSGSDGSLFNTSETKQSMVNSGLICSIAETNNTNNETVIGDVNGDTVPDIALDGQREI